ncbi:MAG: redoxin family protein [Pseudomonadota bacterium]
MNRWIAIVPLLALIALAIIGAQNLMREEKPSAGLSDNRPAPTRAFQRLEDAPSPIRFNPNTDEKAVVVNLFASWCGPCEVEHPLLMALSEQHPDRLVGLLYKDDPENGRAFLARLGNPFQAVGQDPSGQGGIDFGLTGVPETFVVGADGIIKLHVRGPLTPNDVDKISSLLNSER